tara:strand:- start:2318 stop:3751 length:1434 start_codon:yes stop_codon:yes gene_type:complete
VIKKSNQIQDKKMSQNKAVGKYEAPIADYLLACSKSMEANFHTLPVFSMKKGVKGFDKYAALYGPKYFSLESTMTGASFDSFFFPERIIKKSQGFVARAFGANDSLFITCGTTIANYIAVDAMTARGSRVLLDRDSHQSMHFALNGKSIDHDYFYRKSYCKKTDRNFLDVDDLVTKVKNAVDNGRPYDLIIITASSYDGVINDIYKIIEKVVCISPKSSFLIDEAWSSAYYFHPLLEKYTAGYAAKKTNGEVNIVATQSAHKSLNSLRQGSLIHSFANDEITKKLYKSRFKYHSTSPSYPILASIDLARAQMERFGEELVNNAFTCASKFSVALKNKASLSKFIFKSNKASLYEVSNGICVEDPLKAHLDIDHLSIKGCELQDHLFKNYGIYFNRFTEHTALLNFHIGINESQVDRLLEGLVEMVKMKEICQINEDDFVISYPPGIPIRTPCERMNSQTRSIIQKRLKSGISVFQVG